MGVSKDYWTATDLVLTSGVRVSRQQDTHDLGRALLRCEVKWCVAILRHNARGVTRIT